MEKKEQTQKQSEHTVGKRRGSRFLQRTMAFGFCGAVLLLVLISLIMPDRSFSEEENRVLSKQPKFGVTEVMNKEYMEGLESYTSDQFVFRDLWIKLKVQCDLLTGKRELNGVYLGKDKYLIQAISEPDQEHVKENIKGMNAFAARHQDLNINAIIVPNAAYVMQDYLPKGAPVRDQGKDMKEIQKQLDAGIGCIDVTKTLQKHVEEGMYYKTDHHWTSRAAAYAFNAAAVQLGIEGASGDYQRYTVTNEFSGTLSSKSGYHKAEDTIEVFEPEGVDVKYLVSDSDDQEQRPTVYDKKALKEKDKYQVFFGGNHAQVDITTTNDTTKRLLIFKDSYANCFVPFLIPYYNEIIMVDPRYYYDNVETLISGKHITDVLFLYNMDTFLTDTSIAGVLAEE